MQWSGEFFEKVGAIVARSAILVELKSELPVEAWGKARGGDWDEVDRGMRLVLSEDFEAGRMYQRKEKIGAASP